MAFPFSYEQAEQACRDFCDLIGKPLEVRSDLCEPIAKIVIAPFDELNKWIFLQNLNETNCVDRALSLYQSPYYDVILLARFVDKEGYYYKDLRSYCEAHTIAFDINKYATATDPVIRWKLK
jgi:hypothetical protein